MKYTDNLNLRKPDRTDYVDIMDINYNMDILDAVDASQIPFTPSSPNSGEWEPSQVSDALNILADSRIVEYGENGNGEYWRWENGLQLCWFRKQSNRQYTSELALDWIYPAVFSEKPVVLALEDAESVVQIGLHNVYKVTRNLGAENLVISYRPISGSFQSGDKMSAGLFAIGRWK